jgi:hypothetical protein
MRIKDIPQVGKLGLTVTWPGRNGLIRRTLVTPANPRTPAQLGGRDILQQQARKASRAGGPVDVSACMECVWREYGGSPPASLTHPEPWNLGEPAVAPSPALKGTLSPFEGERERERGPTSIPRPAPLQVCDSGTLSLARGL